MRTCYTVKNTDIIMIDEANGKCEERVVLKKIGSKSKCFEIANQLNMAVLRGMQLAHGDANLSKLIKDEHSTIIKAIMSLKNKEIIE